MEPVTRVCPAILTGLTAIAFAGCAKDVQYGDRGPVNVTIQLDARDSSFRASRDVWAGVYAGPMGAETYLGSRRVTGTTELGVPVGASVNLVLAFEEATALGGSSKSQSVVHELGTVRAASKWYVRVAYHAQGFSHDIIHSR